MGLTEIAEAGFDYISPMPWARLEEETGETRDQIAIGPNMLAARDVLDELGRRAMAIRERLTLFQDLTPQQRVENLELVEGDVLNVEGGFWTSHTAGLSDMLGGDMSVFVENWRMYITSLLDEAMWMHTRLRNGFFSFGMADNPDAVVNTFDTCHAYYSAFILFDELGLLAPLETPPERTSLAPAVVAAIAIGSVAAVAIIAWSIWSMGKIVALHELTDDICRTAIEEGDERLLELCRTSLEGLQEHGSSSNALMFFGLGAASIIGVGLGVAYLMRGRK